MRGEKEKGVGRVTNGESELMLGCNSHTAAL